MEGWVDIWMMDRWLALTISGGGESCLENIFSAVMLYKSSFLYILNILHINLDNALIKERKRKVLFIPEAYFGPWTLGRLLTSSRSSPKSRMMSAQGQRLWIQGVMGGEKQGLQLLPPDLLPWSRVAWHNFSSFRGLIHSCHCSVLLSNCLPCGC